MFRMKWAGASLLLLLALVMLVSTAAAQQILPPSNWYAVAWAQDDDTLHWINSAGEQAMINRPHLPDEVPDAEPQMKMSRDGRFLVIATTLNNSNKAIGIYDLQNGQFLQTHQAQPGEDVALGRDFTTSSFATNRIAVGLFNTDFNNPGWRIIIFDMTTGNAVNVLTSDNAVGVNVGPNMMPIIKYYGLDEGLGQEVVHFVMLPIAAGISEDMPAFAWLPDLGIINSSPYTRVDGGIHATSGESVFAHDDQNFGFMPPPVLGPNHNSIAREFKTVGQSNPTTFWVDGTSYNYGGRWANNGQWALYFSDNGQGLRQWNIVLADGTPFVNTRLPLGANAEDAYGTPNGALLRSPANVIFHVTDINNPPAASIFQSPFGQPLDIIYVTPFGSNFGLPSVPAGGAGALVGAVDLVAPSGSNCPGAMPSVVSTGDTGIVTAAGDALRLRTSAPGGNIIAELPTDTRFEVLNGPQCADDLAWFNIRVTTGNSTGQIGWSAEAASGEYFMDVAPDIVVINPNIVAVIPSATPFRAIVAVIPTATPIQAIIAVPIDTDCSQAPRQRVQVGMNVRTDANGGTLAMRINLTDEFPTHQVPDQIVVNVIGGPACRQGFRMWRVRANIGGQQREGWVSEGTTQRYFLNPV